MNSFNTSKQKILTTYNTDKSNSISIAKKTNNTAPINLDSQLFSKTRILYDSGEVWLDVGVFTNTNIDQNRLLPVTCSYWHESTINIPQKFIPFVDWRFSFNATEDNLMVPFVELDIDDWDTNYFDISGDGNQIWKGSYPPSAYPSAVSSALYSSFVTTLSSITNGYVLESMTRPAWKITIEWTEGGNQYRIIDGALNGFRSNYYDTSASPCGGNTDRFYLTGSLWWDTHSDYPSGNFNSITGTDMKTLNVTGRQIHEYWTGTEESCNYNTDYTDGITLTLNLTSDISSLGVYGRRMRKSGSVYVYDPIGSGQGYSTYYNVPVSGIITWTPVQDKYFVYWDTNRRFLFSLTYNYTTTPASPILNNLPISLGSLPYDEINVLVNPDPYPKKVSERVGYTTKSFVRSYVDTNGPMDAFWIRTSKSSDTTESWMTRLAFSALRMVEATVSQPLTYWRWNDVYVPNGLLSGYELGSSSHTTIEKLRWTTPQEQVAARVVAEVRNPLYWKKTEKFTINRS